MQIINEPKLDFDDVLIRPKRTSLSSRADVDLNRKFLMPHSDRILIGIPLIASNMDTVGTITAGHELNKLGCFVSLHKHQTDVELLSNNNSNSFLTIGMNINNEYINKKIMLAGMNSNNMKLCIDVANGYQEIFVERIKSLRYFFPNSIIMAGNVCTPDMTESLILAGADIIKIGIGPGSQCETRKVTGVGYPQLSAIIECADAAHGVKGLICADGGCKTSGDIAKAFAAGADFVMLGTMLAGHKENISNEETLFLLKNNKNLNLPCDIKVKTYGMSSTEAMNKHSGGVSSYRSSEGKTSLIEYRGSIDQTINQILGGIRSTCSYVGADSLKELSKRTTFVIKK